MEENIVVLTTFDRYHKIADDALSLRSKVLVEVLFEKNKDIFAIGVQIHTEMQQNWPPRGVCEEGSAECDARRVLWSICCYLDGLKEASNDDPGYHFGDCTDVACSCERCIAEDIYNEGERTIALWKDIRGTENVDIVELLAVLLSTQYEWIKWHNIIVAQVKNGNNDGRDELDNIHKRQELPERYTRWLGMSKDEQATFLERAKTFYGWFTERPVIEGIPWWD